MRTNDQSPSNISIEKEHEVFDDSKRDNLDSYDENFDNEDLVLDTTFGLFNVEDEFDFNDTNTSFAYEFDDIELAETSENYNLMNVDGAYDQDILESNNELPCTTKGYLPVEVQSILSVNESKKEHLNIYNSGTPKDKNKKEKRSKKVS